MRRVVLGVGIVAASTLAVLPAMAGNSSGQGAQRSPLYQTSGSNGNNCQAGGSGPTNGFVILNTAGSSTNPNKTLGEVALKHAPYPQGTTFEVWFDHGGNCTMAGTLTVHSQTGNGNAHIVVPPTQGQAYVVLTDMSGNEKYASAPVTLK